MTGSDADERYLKRVLRKLVQNHQNEVYLHKIIPKARIYQGMSWWHGCTKDETREDMRALARAFDGIAWTNHGLRIAPNYLQPGAITSACSRATGEGGGADGVEA